jgi:hypothetical protein
MGRGHVQCLTVIDAHRRGEAIMRAPPYDRLTAITRARCRGGLADATIIIDDLLSTRRPSPGHPSPVARGLRRRQTTSQGLDEVDPRSPHSDHGPSVTLSITPVTLSI